MAVDKRSVSSDEFHSKYDYLKPNETAEQDYVVIYGMSHGFWGCDFSTKTEEAKYGGIGCAHNLMIR